MRLVKYQAFIIGVGMKECALVGEHEFFVASPEAGKLMRYTTAQGFLRQFTGLLDKDGKDGKEIYEGDIVRVQTGNPFAVEWNKYRCAFNVEETACRYGIEVIGNIYENPDLLK